MSDRVCAVVVTYNRKALLRECLQALLSQTEPLHEVLVVNNASDDGTAEMLAREFPGLRVLDLPKNIGGAGGFHEGIKRTHGEGYDWIWLMDDDSIPEPSALEKLLLALPVLRSLNGRPALLASKVVWEDGGLHPMNKPLPHLAKMDLFTRALEHGYMPIRSASFVSILLRRDAVDKYGLPYKDFFIWGDDLEYSARILHGESGYLVPQSVVVHKTKKKYSPRTSTSPRFYYQIRNKIWILKASSFTRREKLHYGKGLLISIRNYLRASPRPGSLKLVLSGIAAGVLVGPKE